MKKHAIRLSSSLGTIRTMIYACGFASDFDKGKSFRTHFSHFIPRSVRTHFQTRYELTWVRNDFLFCCNLLLPDEVRIHFGMKRLIFFSVAMYGVSLYDSLGARCMKPSWSETVHLKEVSGKCNYM